MSTARAGRRAASLREVPPARRSLLAGRIEVLLAALHRPARRHDFPDLVAALEAALRDAGTDEMWLALAVLTARLPDTAAVLRATRATRLDGAGAALLEALPPQDELAGEDGAPVEVVTGVVVVDINHTARTSLSTGIQRVARETVGRWARDHAVLLIGWNDDNSATRRLTPDEVVRALEGPGEDEPQPPEHDGGVIVPWQCTFVVPELAAEPARASRLQALARFSGSTTGFVGFDCVPIMAADTAAEGMAGGFATYLGAAAQSHRIATISEAAAVEYRGWRAMLAGAGQAGPDIRAISLPVEGRIPSDEALREAELLLGLGALPVVLAVGSHEPRKNHLAVLQAAEVLWREGLQFTLALVGGNSWNSARFAERVRSLQAANRPLQTIRALPDDVLWAAYRLARCTVFPSLHEGFGLPVAESLVSGTPVITSNFGSMREIGSHGGAVLVDPRCDEDLIEALRRLLLDDALHGRLAAEATMVPRRTWDDYAAEVWAYLVDGADPVGTDP